MKIDGLKIIENTKMKIEKSKTQFESINLKVETQKEFDFLYGLFDAKKDERKEDCKDYDIQLDLGFFKLLEELK